MRRAVLLPSALAVAFLSLPSLAPAEPSTALTRDEVTAVKRRIQAVETALGAAPAGFERSSENFNLPTEFSPAGDDGKKFYPVSGGVTLKYDGGTERIGQQTTTQMQDLQKKMSDAMAAGNYDEVGKIQQQMMQQANVAQSAAVTAGAKGTIDVDIHLNQGGGETIDPDAVLFERPGVLALKTASSGDPNQSHVTVYVDPVGLKNTRQLSTVTLRHDPAPKKTAALNAVVAFTGPAATIEAWAQKINTEAVLAQLDR